MQKQFQQQKRDTKIRPQLGKARKNGEEKFQAFVMKFFMPGTEALVKGEDRWLPSTQDKKKHTKTMEQAFLRLAFCSVFFCFVFIVFSSNLNKLTLETFGLLSRHLAELVREAASATQLQVRKRRMRFLYNHSQFVLFRFLIGFGYSCCG